MNLFGQVEDVQIGHVELCQVEQVERIDHHHHGRRRHVLNLGQICFDFFSHVEDVEKLDPVQVPLHVFGHVEDVLGPIL